MTKGVLRIGAIVCLLMVIAAGLSIGQGVPVSSEKASAPPIGQAGRYTYLIPQSAHSPGNLGSNWRTDVVLHNVGPFEATINLYFLKVDTDNTLTHGIRFILPSDVSHKFDDIVRTMFGQESSLGALLVGSDQKLIITSRTFNDDPRGTFGQFVEGYPIEKAIAANEEVRLIGLAENATRRTNIGFANATEKTLDILVAMYKADGTKLGEKTYQVPPYGFIKRDKILKLEFGATNVDNAFAVISSSTPGARYFSYASLTDNLSNDPVCIIPVGSVQQTKPAEILHTSTFIDESVRDTPPQFPDAVLLRDKSALLRAEQWRTNGPWGGFVNALTIDPSSPQTVYAGTWEDGVFKTTDGGGTWTAMNNGLPRDSYHHIIEIEALTIDPANPETLYAGTEGGGVFKSTNGGGSWTTVNTGLSNNIVYALAIDPSSPQTVYAASWNYVYKSINGGVSWTAVNTGLSQYNTLAIDPTSPRTVYAGAYGEGVVKTVNGGVSWTAVNIGLSNLRVFALAIDPSSPQTVYTATEAGVFKTMNGGGFWTAVNAWPSKFYVYAFAIDPSSPQTVYVGTWQLGVFKSTNGGSSWTAVNAGLFDRTVNALAIDPSSPQTVYAGTGGGVYRRDFAPCQFMISTTSADFSRTGGKGAIEVAATASDCPWTAQSNAQWINIIPGAWGSGNGMVRYTVDANTTMGVRSGMITVAGQTFTVTQTLACGFLMPPTLNALTSAISGKGFRLSWDVTSPTNSYELQEATTAEFVDAQTRNIIGTSATIAHTVIIPTTFYMRVRAIDVCNGQNSFSEWSSTVATIVNPGQALILPAAASAKGSVDTNWHTDLEVHNPGPVQSSFIIALFARDQNNSTPVIKTFSLGANQSIRYPDVLQSVFGYAGTATLSVVPGEGSLIATGRTSNLLESGNKLGLPEGATFGQFIPGKPDAEAISYGKTGRIVQLSQSMDETSGFRTNIGFSSVVNIPITIEIKLFKGDGTYLTTRTFDLAPFGYKQINTIFANVIGSTMDDGYAEVKSTKPGGRFFAYASVTDNKSGDPIYIPAVVR